MALVTIAVVVSILNVAALALGATPAGAQTLGTVDVAATATGYLTVDTGGNVTAVNTAHLGNASVGQAAALAATRSGDGYWIAGADGSIHTFGNAAFHGDLRHLSLAQPIIAMAVSPSGNGYWLVGADGGVFSFGDASFHGSLGALTLDQPVIGVTGSVTGGGYFMVGADGGVFSFGDAPFLGSIGGTGRSDIVALSPSFSGAGYYVVGISGDTFGFGDATAVPAPAPANPAAADLLARMNAERQLRGVAPLRWDPELAVAATSWSHDMSRNGLRHSNLSALSPTLDTQHYALGENIYWGSHSYATSGSSHEWFMNSPAHRNNVLDGAYTSVGLGVVCVGGEVWVTQVFGHPSYDGAVTWSPDAPANPRADTSGLVDVSC